MPAISSITLNAKLYSVVGIDNNGVSKFEDRSSGIPIGFPVLTTSLRRAKTASAANRAVSKLVLPVLEIVTGSTVGGTAPLPSKAYDNICNIEVATNARSNTAERTELLTQTRDYVNSSSFADLVVNLDTDY